MSSKLLVNWVNNLLTSNSLLTAITSCIDLHYEARMEDTAQEYMQTAVKAFQEIRS
jgi:hypothetical protein